MTEQPIDEEETQTRECPYCEWAVEKEIATDTEEIELDRRAESHYHHAHCGSARVTVTFEAEWSLHPDEDPSDLSDAALDRFEDDPVPGFVPAYASVEVLEEADRDD